MSHEDVHDKIPQLHFIPEGFPDPDSPEFMEQFFKLLYDRGYDTDNLVFSGIDGKYLQDADKLDKPNAIFGMNAKGWHEVMRKKETTPAGYVKKDADIPCVALFDATHLAEPKTYRLVTDPDDYTAPISIEDINPGSEVKVIQPEDIVEEVVIHKDFPNASPVDALVGLVFIEEEAYNDSDSGL